MRKMWKEMLMAFQKMNKISKKSITYGIIPVIMVYTSAAALYISAGKLTDYYASTQLAAALLEIGKECLGAVVVTSLIVEIIDIAIGKEAVA